MTYTNTIDESPEFNLEKMMEAIRKLNSLPLPMILNCNSKSVFAMMGVDFVVHDFMPENTAFIMQGGKVVQLWKLEDGKVTAYELKEPIDLYPSYSKEWQKL